MIGFIWVVGLIGELIMRCFVFVFVFFVCLLMLIGCGGEDLGFDNFVDEDVLIVDIKLGI